MPIRAVPWLVVLAVMPFPAIAQPRFTVTRESLPDGTPAAIAAGERVADAVARIATAMGFAQVEWPGGKVDFVAHGAIHGPAWRSLLELLEPHGLFPAPRASSPILGTGDVLAVVARGRPSAIAALGGTLATFDQVATGAVREEGMPVWRPDFLSVFGEPRLGIRLLGLDIVAQRDAAGRPGPLWIDPRWPCQLTPRDGAVVDPWPGLVELRLAALVERLTEVVHAASPSLEGWTAPVPILDDGKPMAVLHRVGWHAADRLFDVVVRIPNPRGLRLSGSGSGYTFFDGCPAQLVLVGKSGALLPPMVCIVETVGTELELQVRLRDDTARDAGELAGIGFRLRLEQARARTTLSFGFGSDAGSDSR